jgi:assimilatory nitrate reductase catalytic subunit
VRWPAPTTADQGGYRYYHDGEWDFATDSGLAQFSSAGQEGLPEPTSEAYPLTLTTARESDGYNTGVRTRDVEDPGPVPARVHPETIATTDGVAAKGTASLVTDRASVPTTLEADTAVPEGLVWIPIHHPLANRLTLDALDPQSREPHFKQCAVRLEPAEEAPEARATAADD